jgi:heterodisulfide reductase subunit D
MGEISFETALGARVDEMVDACTRCGKCVEVCPSVTPAGIADVSPGDVMGGILDILRTGEGPEASSQWAASCMLSGECIKACDEGVNPRFLLAMARVALAKSANQLPERRRQGVARFREISRDVTMLSRLQLDDEALERLGQKPAAAASAPVEAPDFVFYTGCNVLKTPHIALLALDIMDALGVSYRVMGGPTHCCGISQLRAGDVEMSGRMGSNSIEKLSQSKSGQVISWCPSCYVQFTETTLPALAHVPAKWNPVRRQGHAPIGESTALPGDIGSLSEPISPGSAVERQAGARPFEMTPFLRFLRERLAQLTPLLRRRLDLRLALHRHPGVAGVMEAATDILQAIPGVTLVDLKQPAVGLQSVNLGVLPAFKRELQRSELEAASDAGVDALVAVYHSDHRELCAHQRDWPFRIVNILEVIGESMGLHRQDRYKELKLMQDADQIVAECADLIAQHALDAGAARSVVVTSLLGDQPLPLK